MSSHAVNFVEFLKRAGDQLNVQLEPVKCGSSPLTALPTFFFLGGTIMLLHQVVISSGRTLFWRRTNRDLILQEILLFWLICQSLKLWWSIVKLAGFFAAWLWTQIYPQTSYHNLLSDSKSVSGLPALVILLIEPNTIKNLLLFFISIIPLIVIQNIHSRNNFSQFMFWIGTNRDTRSEIGTARYYLERPVLPSTLHEQSKNLFRNSYPSFKSIFNGISKIKSRSKSI